MNLTLGFSSCPNDTFIFDAMVHGKIDTEGLTFNPCIADVETLNQKAFKSELDVTKLSFHAFGFLRMDYALLNAGSALGRGCGPIVISKDQLNLSALLDAGWSVAIPGKCTTANLLFSIACPQIVDKREVLFSEIEGEVLSGRVDLGIIIHENRFTYLQKGLHKVLDLGEYWERLTGAPIPLGGIAVRKNLGSELVSRVDRVMKRSVEFAMQNPESGREYVLNLAGEMDSQVVDRHIGLYVNGYTVDLGPEGRAAIDTLFEKAGQLNIFEEREKPCWA